MLPTPKKAPPAIASTIPSMQPPPGKPPVGLLPKPKTRPTTAASPTAALSSKAKAVAVYQSPKVDKGTAVFEDEESESNDEVTCEMGYEVLYQAHRGHQKAYGEKSLGAKAFESKYIEKLEVITNDLQKH